MPEPNIDVVEGLSENEIEALAAWMLEKEAQSYYGGPSRALGGPAQLLGPTRVPETIKGAVSTQLRAMNWQQKRQKAAKALASIDTNTLADIAPGAYMFRRIIEQVSSLPSAQPEVPPELAEQWGPAGAAQPTTPTPTMGTSRNLLAGTDLEGYGGPGMGPGVSYPIPKTPQEPSPYAALAGLTGEDLDAAIREMAFNYAVEGKLFARNEKGALLPGVLSPEMEGLLVYRSLFGGEGALGGAGAGGMTAYQSAQLGIQQQQLENERARIQQAMQALQLQGAGNVGDLWHKGSQLALQAALYAAPEGDFAPGFEPGGPVERFYAATGTPYTPRKMVKTTVFPYRAAENMTEYLKALGLGVTP